MKIHSEIYSILESHFDAMSIEQIQKELEKRGIYVSANNIGTRLPEMKRYGYLITSEFVKGQNGSSYKKWSTLRNPFETPKRQMELI